MNAYNEKMSDEAALEELSLRIARLATHYDVVGQWPEQSIDQLTQAGAWRWVIPERYGGLGLDPRSQTLAYEAIAAGCMATLLILTQRDAACELIVESDNEQLKDAWLPRLARGEVMTSVGISQLTTSHQTGSAALTAGQRGGKFVLNGFIPWVTGAKRCAMVVTGAVLDDGRQILAVLPTDWPGVVIDPPMQLMALQASETSEIHLRNVELDGRFLLRGPVEHALSSRSTVKPIVVATAGVGLAGAMARLIRRLAESASSPLAEQATDLQNRYVAVRDRLYAIADSLGGGAASEAPKTELRIMVNDLLIRLAAGVLIFAKGSGFLRQREAQRLVREAMFFLVWSAPEDVRAGTLGKLLERPAPSYRSMSRN